VHCWGNRGGLDQPEGRGLIHTDRVADSFPDPASDGRAPWASQTATFSDAIARFRSAGLNVETQPPPTTVIFGAERVDLFLIQGETTAIYTFATEAAGARARRRCERSIDGLVSPHAVLRPSCKPSRGHHD
jgi:hypothetical protein